MVASVELDKLAPALVAAQAELVGIKKSKRNPHLGNKYADLESILDVVRPVFARHGLALVQGAEWAHGKPEVLLVSSTLLHVSGQWKTDYLPIPVLPTVKKGGEVVPAGPQQVVAALTYGRRALVSAQGNIAAEDDDDGNPAQGVPVVASAPAAPADPDVIPGGAHKGKRLGDLSRDQLEALKKEIGDPSKNWYKKVEAELARTGKVEATKAMRELEAAVKEEQAKAAASA